MKNFKIQKAYQMFICIVCVFIILPGCSGGVFGGGRWDKPNPPTITAYSFNGVTGTVAGTINETAKTIAVTMPFSTDVTTLVATYTTNGKSVKVGATVQASATTANNFTGPVLYTVTGTDSSTATYTVTVTVASAISKAITAFSIDGVPGTINPIAHTILVTMPFGTNITGSGPAPMIATYNATASDVRVANVPQTSPATAPRDFSNLVVYTVTAVDTSAVAYTVIVKVASAIANAITAFSIDGVTGTINPTSKTIAVIMPFGTNILGSGPAPMIASYTATATDVRVAKV